MANRCQSQFGCEGARQFDKRYVLSLCLFKNALYNAKEELEALNYQYGIYENQIKGMLISEIES